MSLLDLSTDIPSNIASAEQLASWILLTLYSLHRGETYSEAQGNSIDSGRAPLVDVSIVTAADGKPRLIARMSVELDPAYLSDASQKVWMFARDFGAVVIPDTFKTN